MLAQSHLRQQRGQTRPGHSRGQTRPRRQRGQTTVEYILLVAVVVGGMFAFKDALLGPLVTILGGTTQALRVEATRGGAQATQEYYGGSCATTDTTGGC